jgi:hypothetical protein
MSGEIISAGISGAREVSRARLFKRRADRAAIPGRSTRNEIVFDSCAHGTYDRRAGWSRLVMIDEINQFDARAIADEAMAAK